MNPFTQHYPSLLRQAALLLSGSAASQAMQPSDLLHMAMEKLCRRPPAQIEEHPCKFNGLLRTIMQRTLVDEKRKSRASRRPDLSAAYPLEDALHIAAEPASAGMAGAVREALVMLESENASAAELLRLHFLEGRTGLEIAAASGLSTACISRRLSHAVLALRQVMTASGDFRPKPAALAA
jgi:RNA polymerase sigma factor (sigma-70 family)